MLQSLTSEISSKVATFLGSSPSARAAGRAREGLAAQYEERGHTDVVRIVEPDRLRPVQEVIYEKTAHLLVPHDPSLSLTEKLRLPLKEVPPKDDWRELMKAVNDSPRFEELILYRAPEVRAAFEKVFDDEVEPYPIVRFRAQFPDTKRSVYDWHQDEGTWYATSAKALSHWAPATLWLSVNGADETNAIEIIPYSHLGHLEHHHYVEGQGYFSTKVPRKYRGEKTFVPRTQPGEGVLFHPLAIHRSVQMTGLLPRYSVDIRYCRRYGRVKKYKVRLSFFLKRLFTKSEA